ncbi:MAG: helix-turn-helix transcriptional regulator [Vampirovibrionales bacterium]|nr:helix-turn-helix transcriptional regulator [Vampirovibrionales bacterium]
MSRLTLPLHQLPDNLANRVQFLREHLDMTPRQLASKASVAEAFIQDIEAGLEMFLAPAVRLKLARALRVRPSILQDVERRPKLPNAAELSESAEWQKTRKTKQLLEAVALNPTGDYHCPDCEASLIIRQFQRRDLEDNLLLTLKVECSNCLFRWSTD